MYIKNVLVSRKKFLRNLLWLNKWHSLLWFYAVCLFTRNIRLFINLCLVHLFFLFRNKKLGTPILVRLCRRLRVSFDYGNTLCIFVYDSVRIDIEYVLYTIHLYAHTYASQRNVIGRNMKFGLSSYSIHFYSILLTS